MESGFSFVDLDTEIGQLEMIAQKMQLIMLDQQEQFFELAAKPDLTRKILWEFPRAGIRHQIFCDYVMQLGETAARLNEIFESLHSTQTAACKSDGVAPEGELLKMLGSLSEEKKESFCDFLKFLSKSKGDSDTA